MSVRQQIEAFAAMLAVIRDFFDSRGVTEVVTPALAPAAPTDPAIGSLSTRISTRKETLYLHSSPEYAMKQLLAAGSGDIYQLARVFRDGEVGRWHAPEFMLLEWYRTGFDDRRLIDETWELLQALFQRQDKTLDRLDISYADAIGNALNIDPHRMDRQSREALSHALIEQGVDIPADLSDDALLDLALSTVVVPGWPAATAVFLYDYPASQAALARLRRQDPPVAARFEVFIDGIELGNGYHELTDTTEQRQRFERDLVQRRRAGLPQVPIDEALLNALEQGLPDCAGIAIGMERLFAVLSDAASLDEAQLLNWATELNR